LVAELLQKCDTVDEFLEQQLKYEQELAQLKLQMSQLQQEHATSAKELLLKDEIIFKMQSELQQMEEHFTSEIKMLQDSLNSAKTINDDKYIHETQLACLNKEKQGIEDKLSEPLICEVTYKNRLVDYELTISNLKSEMEELRQESETSKRHLSTLEVSFSDLHSKYERCKEIILGLRSNEEALVASVEQFRDGAKKYQDRYEALKVHATEQLQKANTHLDEIITKHSAELMKQNTIIKRLEIKNSSIQQALDQKSKECEKMTALLDELTLK